MDELRAAASLPWTRETVGHATIGQIANSVAADLAVPPAGGVPPNTDATWISNAAGRIVAFVGNGPRQTDNADLIIAAVAAYLAPAPAWVVPDGYTPDGVGGCRSCHDMVLWVHTKAGKRAPLNPDGTSHFATCPQAPTWRKPHPLAAAMPEDGPAYGQPGALEASYKEPFREEDHA